MSSRAGRTPAVAIAVAAVTAFAALAAFGVLQQDFAAYWVAGSARRLGLDPYVNHAVPGVAPALWDGSVFHHSRFLYPPLAADLFRPLAALPYRAAKVVFTALLVGAWIAAAALLGRGARRAAALPIAGAAFFPLYLNLERGQIELLLLALVAGAWTVRDRAPLAGGLFASAAVFKPALLGVLPVLAALGRWRCLGAVFGWCAVFGAVTLVVCGPSLVREYGASVLPRALLYGEGGTDEMAYHERELERVGPDEHGARQSIDGRSYRYALPVFDRPVSASVPRLLAPESPSWATSLLPYLIAVAGLTWAARRGGSAPAPGGSEREPLLLSAALVACVVTSPTGWAMGFVWALPMVPVAMDLLRDARLPQALRAGLGAAWIACALPPPFAGWPALAGAALVVAAGAAAARAPEPA
jgi:alpha-1,2-mannosyltransferase